MLVKTTACEVICMSGLGNKEIMASNIKYYMKLNDVKPIDVCRALHFAPATFSDWINGKTYPRIDKIEMMSNYFGINKSDLVEERIAAPVPDSSTSIRVLGSVAAGVPIEMVEDVIGFEEIPEALARKGEFFALKIKGDSMEPRIYDGDIVVVRKTPDAESGSIVIVSVNGDDATCKRLVKYRDSIQLVSLNPKYLPKEFSADEIEALPVRILGECVEVRGSLKY